MITLTAKINLLSGGNDTLRLLSNNLSTNNISCPPSALLGSNSKGGNPFLLGSTKFSENATLSSGERVDYFISSTNSDDNGNFATPFEFTIEKTSLIKSLTIAFDTYNNRFPRSIIVDDVTFSDDDPLYTVNTEMTIDLQSDIDTHKIVIPNWNTPNAPLVITGIYVDITIEIGYNQLLGITSKIADRGDFNLPSYGIISNVGTLEFSDFSGEIGDYASQHLLDSGAKVEIKLNNTIANKHQVVSNFYASKWSYDNNSRRVSVSLKDDLEEWQNIVVEGFFYDAMNSKPLNGEYFYRYLHGKTPSKYNMLAFEGLDTNTQMVLQDNYIKYPFLDQSTLWQQWQKLCTTFLLKIYKNKNGITTCIWNGGM